MGEVQQFCRKVRDRVLEHPDRAHDEDMLRFRKYCDKLDERLDNASRVKDSSGIQLGYDMYLDPSEEYPIPPPALDGRGFDARVHSVEEVQEANASSLLALA